MSKRLSKQGTSSSVKFRRMKVTSRKGGPLLWIDFTDKRTVFSDDSGTLADADDTIQVALNKAHDARFGKAGNNALGSSVKQVTSSKRPQFKAGGQNGHSYALFSAPALQTLIATSAIGNVGTNLLSASRLSGQDTTIFYVARSTSATPGNRAVIDLGTSDGGGGSDPIMLGTQSNHDYRVFIGDQSDKSGTVILDSGAQATTNVEIWTVKLGGNGASHYYRNGNTSDGTTSGASKDHDYHFNTNDPGTFVQIGGAASGKWDGSIYEVLIFIQALPDKEIKEIERQLKQKYNL